MKKILPIVLALAALFASCNNGDESYSRIKSERDSLQNIVSKLNAVTDTPLNFLIDTALAQQMIALRHETLNLDSFNQHNIPLPHLSFIIPGSNLKFILNTQNADSIDFYMAMNMADSSYTLVYVGSKKMTNNSDSFFEMPVGVPSGKGLSFKAFDEVFPCPTCPRVRFWNSNTSNKVSNRKKAETRK